MMATTGEYDGEDLVATADQYDVDDRAAAPQPEFLDLVDQLFELVGSGRRLPFTAKVAVEEEAFVAIIEQLRVTVPAEIQRAETVVRQREAIITEAQAEAAKILEVARQQSEYIISTHGIVNEARQRGEEYLQRIEAKHREMVRAVDEYAIDQFSQVEAAMEEGANIMLNALREASAGLDEAKRHIGR